MISSVLREFKIVKIDCFFVLKKEDYPMIYPVFLIFFIVLYISYTLFKRINKNNSYHQIYLVTHFSSQTLIILNFCLYLSFDVALPLLFISSIKVISLVSIFKFIASINKQKRAQLNLIDGILFILFFGVYLINFSGLEITNFNFNVFASDTFMSLIKTYFYNYKDVVFVFTLISIYYSSKIVIDIYKLYKNEKIEESTKINILKFSYLYITLFLSSTFISSLFIILNLLNIPSSFILLFNKLLIISSLLVLIAIPFLLKNISSIKPFSSKKFMSEFKQIDSFLIDEKPYLKPTYTLSNLSADLHLSSHSIRQAVKINRNMTVPKYLNSHRINYACSQIENGFLDKFSVNALVNKCGFGSQQSFNRSFKHFCNKTPNEYLKSLKK